MPATVLPDITIRDWRNEPEIATPLSAENIEDMEGRMGAYAKTIAGLVDAAAQSGIDGLQSQIDGLAGDSTAISALGALTPAADKGIHFVDGTTAATHDLHPWIRDNLLNDDSAATARGTLGVPATSAVQLNSEKNALSGYAGLNASGDLAVGQLPQGIPGAMIWKGWWNAGTNSPTLGPGNPEGELYYVWANAPPGGRDIGAGAVDYRAGEFIFSSLGTWIRIGSAATDPELAAIAGLTSAADKGIVFTGPGAASTFDLHPWIRNNLLNQSGAAGVNTQLGLGTAAAYNVSTGTLAAAGEVVKGNDTRLASVAATGVLRVINLRDDPAYLADATGVTNARAVLVQAIADCAAAGGGIVYLPPGTYYMNGTSGSVITCPNNMTDMVTVMGAGVDATTIKLNPAGTNRGFAPASFSADFRNLTVQDMTLDVNNPASTYQGDVGAIFYADMSNASIEKLRFRRVNIKNMGVCNAGSKYRGMFIRINQSGATWRYARDISMEDMRIGEAPGGGGGGWAAMMVIGANYGALDDPRYAYEDGIGTNVAIDDIRCRRVWWDSGWRPWQNPTTNYNDGFFIGSRAPVGRVRIDDCYCAGAGDTAYEMNNCRDFVMTNSVSVSSRNQPIIFTNFNWPLNEDGLNPPGESVISRQRFVVKDFTVEGPRGSTYGQNGINSEISFGPIPLGEVIIDGWKGNATSTATSTSQYAWYYLTGTTRKLTIKNATLIEDYGTGLIPLTTIDLFTFWPGAGRCKLKIENCRTFIRGKTTSATFVVSHLRFLTGSGVDLEVDGFEFGHDITRDAGNVAVTSYGVRFGDGWQMGEAESFATDTRLRFCIDAGLHTDTSVSGGVLHSAANSGNEQRLIWIDATDLRAGPFVDQCLRIKSTPSTVAGHKTGIVLKRIHDPRFDSSAPPANQSYIDCWVDGTAQALKIDVILKGTRTNRASVPLNTTLVASTPFWVRGKIRGNTITADHFTAVPADAVNTVGNTTATYTLAGTELALGGAVEGWFGFSWKPVTTAATLDDLTHNYQEVISADIKGLRPTKFTGTGGTQYVGRCINGKDVMRMPRLVIRDSDMTRLEEVNAAGAGLGFFNPPDDNIAASTMVERIQWHTAFGAGAVTGGGIGGLPASGGDHTNILQYNYQYFVSAGGNDITAEKKPKGSLLYYPLGIVQTFELQPGDTIRLTYGAGTLTMDRRNTSLISRGDYT